MMLELPPTFIHNLTLSNRPFTIMRGRLYTLEDGENNGDCYHDADRVLGFQESDLVRTFEDKIFLDTPEIESYMNWILDVKVSAISRHLRANFGKLTSLADMLQDYSIERFIMADVFNAYNHGHHEDEKLDFDESEWESMPEVDIRPSRESLLTEKTILDQIIKNSSILVKGGQCYLLKEFKPNGNEFVMFKGTKFAPVHFRTAEDLEKEYQGILHGRIDEIALEHGAQVLEFICSKQDKLAKAKTIVDRLKLYQSTCSAQRGNIGFRKLSSKKYLVFVDIPSYIMGINGKYYARVGMNLIVSGKNIQLDDAPRVVTAPYLHPFVYADGRICYDTEKRWIDRGIMFGHSYSSRRPVELARKISYALSQAGISLRKGYRNNNINPVYSLSSFHPIAANRKEAEIYAAKHGIPLERIVKNC
jgi:hypothetical protein